MNEAVRGFLRALFAATFGSQAGGTGYPFAQLPSLRTVVTAVAVVLVVVVALRFSVPRVRRHEGAIVALWLGVAFAAQLALSGLAYASMSAAIESEGANGFYTVSERTSAADVLSRFRDAASTFPLHVRANMPGKMLLFDALAMITRSTRTMAYVIIVVSNLGGVLVYLLARRWFQDSLTAFYALVLYLFLPARLYFFPALNTVSPVLMLLVFWFATRSFESQRRIDYVLTGAGLYALAIFEPLPLVAMPMLAVLLVRPVVGREINWSRAVVMAGWMAASFGLVYLGMRGVFGFDLLDAFWFLLDDALAFNVKTQRPYSVWIVHNLKDFFLNMGVAQSVVFAAFVVWIVRKLIATSGEFRLSNDVLLTITFLAILLGVDLAGVNRGETVRLWIFLGVLMQMLVARACTIWSERRLFEPVLAVSLLQTALCLTIVAWIIP
ncbi:MAG: hypothetical protein ACRD2N_05030 [Vicinamibacterales bacterium]